MVANKLLAAYSFTSRDQGLFRSNLCGHDRKHVSGYSDLLAHLAGKHDGYETLYVSS
ncbi:hypothetical protein JG687_00012112 [Phytophthora cactorum]|uniref:Uncharacterized protein n=1 Tax=Phytophthora cactorum TaxID=29920 RepID=A0A8T1U6H0_9STRA|nr:hypothetical protein PC116_g17984 [Phytophthora cactorum]KAG6953935.1 hypothetical protein JG687_00012112 [Phytophthora cactorum]